MQIVERPGVKLFNVLKRAMRSGDLRTFSLERRGTRVIHVRSPGYIQLAAPPVEPAKKKRRKRRS